MPPRTKVAWSEMLRSPGDGDGFVIIPAYEAATRISICGGKQTAGVGTVRDIQSASRKGHDAAVAAVVIIFTSSYNHTIRKRIFRAAMDDRGDVAVGDAGRTIA